MPPSTTSDPFTLPDLIAHYGGVEKDVNVACRNCGGNTPHDSRPSYLQTPRVLVIQALRFVVPYHPAAAANVAASVVSSTVDSESNTGTESPTTDSEASGPVAAAALPLHGKSTRPRRLLPLIPLKRKVLKNPAHVNFPLTNLDMTSYLRQPSTNSTQIYGVNDELYDLFGVVEHIGRRMDGGHYIAYIRGKNADGEDCWWKCNDAKCWMVPQEIVSGAQGYIWFYERRSERGSIPPEWPDRMEMKSLENGLVTPESDRPNGIDGNKANEVVNG